jgi:hypothetical protein
MARIESREGFQPLSAQASCPEGFVKPQGTMTCKFTIPLPQPGSKASNPYYWEDAYATVTLGSAATCEAHTSITH